MAGGRPTDFEERFIQIAAETLSSGKSITQLARDLNVTRATIYNWAKDNEQFFDALETGREHSQAFWEDRLEEMMYSKEVNAPLVKLYFANRFKWHDKSDGDNEDSKAQSLNISFEVREPVGDIKVTNAKPK